MKQYFLLFLSTLLSVLLFSCSSDSDELIKEVSIQLNFTQNWDGTLLEKSDISNTKFTYITGTEIKKETKLTIDKLRYLISKIIFTDGAGNTTVFNENYLVNLEDSKNLTHKLSKKISEGDYNISFVFGLSEQDNKSGIHKDLEDLTTDFNLSEELGGGYYFMKMDGKYLDNTGVYSNFKYHTISAFNADTKKTEDTSFLVELGAVSIKNNANIEIKMNIAQWFKNPNDWNLKELQQNLPQNYEAQKKMSANGKDGVFSLGSILQ